MYLLIIFTRKLFEIIWSCTYFWGIFLLTATTHCFLQLFTLHILLFLSSSLFRTNSLRSLISFILTTSVLARQPTAVMGLTALSISVYILAHTFQTEYILNYINILSDIVKLSQVTQQLDWLLAMRHKPADAFA